MKPINNNIEESYCSSKVRKLLKDKGCEIKVENTNMVQSMITHSTATKWIWENFGIYFIVVPIYNGDVLDGFVWNTGLITINNISLVRSRGIFKSYEEATEAALTHILENKIE
jgi:hypothetical protein